MPIQLTIPFNPGDLDPGKTYPEAKLIEININLQQKMIRLTAVCGEEVSGIWQGGYMSKTFNVEIKGEDYDTIILETTISGEDHQIYAGIKRVLYQYLIDEGILEGTIIE